MALCLHCSVSLDHVSVSSSANTKASACIHHLCCMRVLHVFLWLRERNTYTRLACERTHHDGTQHIPDRCYAALVVRAPPDGNAFARNQHHKTKCSGRRRHKVVLAVRARLCVFSCSLFIPKSFTTIKLPDTHAHATQRDAHATH